MDVSDIFYFFGGGEGGVRGARNGRRSGFLLKFSQAGGVLRRGGGGGEGPGGCLQGIWGGGGARFFFFGAEMPTKLQIEVSQRGLLSHFWDLPQSDLKATPKVPFWSNKWLKSDFFGSNCHFGLLVNNLGADPESHSSQRIF